MDTEENEEIEPTEDEEVESVIDATGEIEPVVEEVKPTVEDAIADALKALEPKTDEQKAAEKATADAAAKKLADDKAGVAPVDAPKLDKDGKPIVEAKKVDHVNDPIPPQVSERTRERITSLVGQVKEQAAIVENQGAIIASIQETGATPEEFGAMITYMRYMHSDKPADLEEAYKMLQGGLQTVSLKLGRAIPEVDVLAGHKDLADAIAAGQITVPHAEEIAVGRARIAQANRASTAMQTETQAQAAAETEKATAITELNDLGELLKRADPQYNAKYALIVPALTASFKHMAPKFWKKAFNDAYAAAKVSVAPVVVAPVVKKQVPLRPAAPSGGNSKREPKSLEDAIFGEGFPE